MSNTLIRKKNIKHTRAKPHASQAQAAKRAAQLKRQLRACEERWQAVMNNPIMGITVLDQDHRFIMTNPTFQAMVGYNDAELKTLTALDITPPSQRDLNRRLFREL